MKTKVDITVAFFKRMAPRQLVALSLMATGACFLLKIAYANENCCWNAPTIETYDSCPHITWQGGGGGGQQCEGNCTIKREATTSHCYNCGIPIDQCSDSTVWGTRWTAKGVCNNSTGNGRGCVCIRTGPFSGPVAAWVDSCV